MKLTLVRTSFQALGGTNELQIYAPSEAAGRKAGAQAVALVRGIEEKYSRYRPESVISRINSRAAVEPVAVDAEEQCVIDVGRVGVLVRQGGFLRHR